MAAKKRAAILFVLAVLAASSSAFASIPRSSIIESATLARSPIASGEPLPVISAHDGDALLTRKSVYDEVARLSETRVWASRLSEPLVRQEEPELTRALRKAYGAASGENAEEIRDYAISDLYLAASPESKTKLLTGFKAAPFIEAQTGHAYFRERWLDPSTGNWLTPDPMGYADSSNAYAFARLDPVNLSDPTGELAPLVVAALWWGGGALAAIAADVAIDYALADEGEFDINASIGTNLTINALTGGLGRLKYLRHLGRAARFGVEFGADVAATGTVDMLAYDQSAAYAYGSAAVGGAFGRVASYSLHRGARWLRSAGSFEFDLRSAGDAASHEPLGASWANDPRDWGAFGFRLRHPASSGASIVGRTDRTTTVVGSYAVDMKYIVEELGDVKSVKFGPKIGGVNVLNVPDHLYVTPTQFWRSYNQPWLDAAMARNDDLVLATAPKWDLLTRINRETGLRELSGFGREYLHLLKAGYRYDAASNSMVRTRP
jgi:RHS repeat-associated protein